MTMQSNTSPSTSVPKPAAYTHHDVQLGHVRLNYLDYGTKGKPAILCVHGGGANGHWFDFIAPGLIDDYHVLAVDLRGHGDSDPVEPPSYTYADYALDLDEFARALDLRDFVLIGHSMGGTVSLLYAATYPGRVKSLIIVDTMVNLSQERIDNLRDVGSRGGKAYGSQEELVSRYRLRPGNSLAAHEILAYIAANSCREVEDGWRHKFDRRVYATREAFDARPCWADITVPSLLVKGDRSDRITPEVYADVKARAPQTEFVEVSNSDHHVTLDNPAGFLEAVKPFLAKHR